jgi:hypothetical protein
MTIVIRESMPKKPLSFRSDEDLLAAMRKHLRKHSGVSVTDVLNTALHHFLTASDKKRRKYLRNYKTRLWTEGVPGSETE